jgi:hypothetical protein
VEEIMDNKKLVEKLYKIGKLPTEEIADEIGFPLNRHLHYHYIYNVLFCQ